MSTDIVRGANLGIAAVPTQTALKIADGISFNEWRAIGEQLLVETERLQWWIGDWLNYGERYRRDYAAAMAAIDLKYQTFRVHAYVSGKVLMRINDLSWYHHRIVAPLEPDAQAEWLNEAVIHNWSTRDLEQAIADTRTPKLAQPAFTVRAIGELYELCDRAPRHAGLEPAEWAERTLTQAAQRELGELAEVA